MIWFAVNRRYGIWIEYLYRSVGGTCYQLYCIQRMTTATLDICCWRLRLRCIVTCCFRVSYLLNTVNHRQPYNNEKHGMHYVEHCMTSYILSESSWVKCFTVTPSRKFCSSSMQFFASGISENFSFRYLYDNSSTTHRHAYIQLEWNVHTIYSYWLRNNLGVPLSSTNQIPNYSRYFELWTPWYYQYK